MSGTFVIGQSLHISVCSVCIAGISDNTLHLLQFNQFKLGKNGRCVKLTHPVQLNAVKLLNDGIEVIVLQLYNPIDFSFGKYDILYKLLQSLSTNSIIFGKNGTVVRLVQLYKHILCILDNINI
jgi:hypothetical protein